MVIHVVRRLFHCSIEMKCVVAFDYLLFLHFVMYVFYGWEDFANPIFYGCEDFTHPLGREEKSRVKELVGLMYLRTLEYGLHCMP